ncbi:MAG TPA: type II toxin-antitoxin system HipA family toxin, partial [Marmoricola sp.]|nr:type II toxin-antitoxin system HipA family toxin [Marmoricola sp.]
GRAAGPAMRSLFAVAYDQVIGTLTQAGPRAPIRFTYEAEYQGGLPLSTLMPVAAGRFTGRVVEAFIEGLLPEDPGTRARWGRELDVASDDSMALLSQMGWDAPGAVQFCAPEDLETIRARGSELRRLTEDDIAARIRDLRTRDAASWTLPDEHWSLAGQQSKFALTRTSAGWHEAHGSAATTHIIKPGIGRLHHQALIEHAAMRAASTLGIDVAHTEFVRFGDEEAAIVIERYDRILRPDDSVLRIHQEDFCSATGRLPTQKYEADRGPGMADLMRVATRNATDLQVAAQAIGDFVAFNYVAGAPDGHAKNISMLLTPTTVEVAPLYDLATSLPYDGSGLTREVAIAVGGRRKFGQVLGRHWDRAASILRIPSEEYRRRAREMADGFPDAFTDALRAVGTPDAAEVRIRSTDAIAAHVQVVRSRLDDAPTKRSLA